MKLTALILTASLLALAASALRAGDLDRLNTELAAAAEKVSTFLTEDKRTDIAIGDFVAPPILQSNYGNELRRTFQDALEAKKITVSVSALYAISGKYYLAKDETPEAPNNAGVPGLKIEFEIVDQQNNRVAQRFARQLFDPNVIAAAAGANAVIPPESADKRIAKIVKSLDESDAVLDKTEVHVGQFGLEIGTVNTAGKFEPRTPMPLPDKRPFVALNRDDIYAIRLINNADYDAAIALSVDGLNVFQFSYIHNNKGDNLYTHWIVPAHSSALVPGWHKTNDSSFRFKITDLPDTAAFKARSTGSIGVINALVCPVTKGGQHNLDSGILRAGGGTGFGPLVDFKTRPVNVEFAAPSVSISIRYAK
ncbi:MAG TPA: hypothetical protein VKX17_20555 [Planctomycetota bacterium]|nr:hypothetical protein [Planctomycetota bacterium]